MSETHQKQFVCFLEYDVLTWNSANMVRGVFSGESDNWRAIEEMRIVVD